MPDPTPLRGPRHSRFVKVLEQHGFKEALKIRIEPFSDGIVKIRNAGR